MGPVVGFSVGLGVVVIEGGGKLSFSSIKRVPVINTERVKNRPTTRTASICIHQNDNI